MDIFKDLVFVKIFCVFLLTIFLYAAHCDAGRGLPRSEIDRTQQWLWDANPECKFRCHGSTQKKMCGSNGRTFNSECEARRARCLDSMLTVKLGKCNESACNYARDYALRKLQADSENSVYVPNCTTDGYYAAKQCNVIFHICWCVYPDGKLIQGTVVENAEPICPTGKAKRRSTESCTSSERAMLLPSIRSQVKRDFRKATPRAEVPPTGSDLLRLALKWQFSTVDTNEFDNEWQLPGRSALSVRSSATCNRFLDDEINLRDVRNFLKRMHERQCVTVFMGLCDANHDDSIHKTEWMECLFTPSNTPVRLHPEPNPSTTPTTDILKVHQKTMSKALRSQCPNQDRTTLIENMRDWIFSETERSLTDFSTTTPVDQQLIAITAKFSQLDKNRNGVLSSKEMKILRRKFKKFKFKRCFMFVCDQNNDSIVSAEEFSNCLNTEKPPNCAKDRSDALKSQRAQEAVYVPECDDSDRRYYSQVQCHGATGYCWCANRETGRPIPGTSIRGENPDCGGTTIATTTAFAIEIAGCSRPQQFIASVQKALLKKMVQSQRTSDKDASLRVPTSFTAEVANWYFQSLDTNNDNQVNKKEAKAVRKSLRKKVSPKKCLKKMMRYCDLNNNKKVTQEEFSTCLQANDE